MIDLLIQNVDVLQCAADLCFILRDSDIAIRGNRIESIEPAGSTGAGSARNVVNGHGMLAMPGLINTHAHVPMCIFRGLAEDVDIETWFNEFIWPLESSLTPDDVYAAVKTFMPTGQHDEYVIFASGGHSGQMLVIGVPSMRLLKVVGVFTPEPWQGWG